jgi:hypothetical protein
LEIAPGGALTSGAHAPGTAEHLSVISGAFEITSEDATRTVKASETARYAADVPHEISNTGKRAAKGLLVVVWLPTDRAMNASRSNLVKLIWWMIFIISKLCSLTARVENTSWFKLKFLIFLLLWVVWALNG